MTSTTHPFTRSILCSAIWLALVGQVQAAGFQFLEHSATGLGRAFAGEAAITADPTVIAYNPAGIGRLESAALSIPTINVDPSIDVSHANQTASDIGPSQLLPAFYASMPIGKRLAIGVGGFSNFGLKTDYDQRFASLGEPDKCELRTYNINPVVAWRFSDIILVGVGINYVLADMEMSDSSVVLQGDDTSWGWNLGILEQFNGSQFGFSFRSRVNLKMDADATKRSGTGPSETAAVKYDVDLPVIAEVAILHPLNNQLDIHGSIQYTTWSKYEEPKSVLKVPFSAEPNLRSWKEPPPVEPTEWKNVWRLAAGFTWHPPRPWQLRMGVAYDQSPVDNEHRTLMIPVSDRYWLSLGGSWQVNKSLSLDAGYSHLFADDATVTVGETILDVESSVNIFGLQANWFF